jgi:biopolymer transport protein ExbB
MEIRMQLPIPLRHALAALAVAALIVPGAAGAWWNGDWSARRALQLDNSAAGANVSDPIGPVAVLVRLHTGNFRFDEAKEDGSDLRFVAGDDATPLKHHLEKYDALLGEALVWVGFPDLKPGAKSSFWVYYKNPKAPPADDAKGSFDKAALLAYHFNEKGAAPPRDATQWGHDAAGTLPSDEGSIIGRGLKLDGTGALTIPGAPALAFAAGGQVTFSAWVMLEKADGSGPLLVRRQGSRAFNVGVEDGKPYAEVDAGIPAAGSPAGTQTTVRATAPSGLGAGIWHHLVVTVGEDVAVWLDGALAAKAKGTLPALGTPLTVGGPAGPAPSAGAAPLPGLVGAIDELSLASVERTPGWIKVSAVAQGKDPGKFFSAMQDEESGGGGHNYFAILIGSVTIDGWVVIGLLAIMMVVSWVVVFTKAGYLSASEKANELFTARFSGYTTELAAVITMADEKAFGDPKVMARSPLHRIYLVGAAEMRKRTDTGRRLTSEGLESVRASLDAVVVRESQRLNDKMVLLTIAISGGPFLGLLGTVVGVMITFASIAAAGDVNVNAIAPGIAAALVATVAGLAVAIPALFAYNWLLIRVKNLQANHQVFLDELLTKGAEAFAEDHAQAQAPARPAPGVARPQTVVARPATATPPRPHLAERK